MKSSNLFITGCDKNTRWLLDWFVDNYKKYNSTSIEVYDFDSFDSSVEAWFKKPRAMLDAANKAHNVVWIDTDCEVRSNIEGIFNFIEPGKLLMAEDTPWTKRTKEKWYNSGVVGFTGKPKILQEWSMHSGLTEERGDQEVLHSILDPLGKLMYIKELSKEYNTLRIDLIDKTTPKDIKVMHWTGAKGKEHIRGMIND